LHDIIFDLDGTLVDSLPGIQCSARHAVSTVFPGRTLPDLRPFVGPPIFEAIYNILGPGARARAAQFETCFRAHYDQIGWQQTQPYPGAIDVLSELKRSGIRCHVVTNKPALPTSRILSRLGLRPHLSRVVCRDSRTPGFRDKAEALRHLLEEFAVPAEAAIMVGDSADDAYAAVACGLPFAAASYGYGDYSRPDLDPELPGSEFILTDLSGLSRLSAAGQFGFAGCNSYAPR
jgi:phosphoglycolate phosphatase